MVEFSQNSVQNNSRTFSPRTKQKTVMVKSKLIYM